MTNIERIYNNESDLRLIDLLNNLIEERIENYANLTFDKIYSNNNIEEVA